jgi:cell wall-associated NlpC family hydrolase
MEAYHRQGIDITRKEYADYDAGKWFTDAQMLWEGNQLHTPIDRVQTAQPGDLVFFTDTYDTSSYITHVALVVSPGRMLGAPGESAGYVDYLASGYWTQHLVEGFGRVRRS